jgi:hypothetical protein
MYTLSQIYVRPTAYFHPQLTHSHIYSMYMNVIHAENSLLKSHDTELFSAHRSELIVQSTVLQIKTVHVNSFYFIADSGLYN